MEIVDDNPGARAAEAPKKEESPPSRGQAPRVDPGHPRSPLVELARGAAWLVGLAAVLQLVTRALGASPLAAVLAGAVIADIGSARAGVRWDDPDGQGPANDPRRVALRLGTGAGLAAIAVALTVALALALGWAGVAATGTPAVAFLLVLLRSAAFAFREELLLTGIAFAAAARAGVPSRYALAFAALAHGAAVTLAPGSSPAAVTLAVALGALTARLWQRRGPLAAIAAAATFHVLAGAGLRGDLLDITWRAGSLTTGARASGEVAWLAAACVVAVLLLDERRLDGRGRARVAK